MVRIGAGGGGRTGRTTGWRPDACCVLFFGVTSRPSRLRPMATARPWRVLRRSRGQPTSEPTGEPTAEPTVAEASSPRGRRRRGRRSSPFARGAATRTPSTRVAGEEAIAELDALGADCLPPLKAHVGMTRAAEDPSNLVRAKRLGHGVGGRAPAQRLNRHGRWFERASECLSHGRRTAVAAVAQMMSTTASRRAQRRGLSDRARTVGCALRMHRGAGGLRDARGRLRPASSKRREVVAGAVSYRQMRRCCFPCPSWTSTTGLSSARARRQGRPRLRARRPQAFRLGRGREGREVRRGLGSRALGGLVHH